MKNLLFIFILFPILLFSETIVGIVGDSISFPHPVLEEEAYYYEISKENNWKIINASVGCSTSDTLLPRVKQLLEKQKIEILIIELGINDAGTGMGFDEIYKNFSDTIEYLKPYNVKIFIGTIDICSLCWYTHIYKNLYVYIYHVLKKNHPQIHLFEFLTEEITTNPIYYASPDRYHPSAEGHKKIAECLRKALSDSDS